MSWLAAMPPWGRAVTLAQDDVRRRFPGTEIPYDSLEAARSALRLLLTAEGHPQAAAAVVVWEPWPLCARARGDRRPVVALGRESVSFLGVAHQAGHLMHDLVTRCRQGGGRADDAFVHGPAFIRYFAGTLGYLNPAAAAYLRERHSLRFAQHEIRRHGPARQAELE